MHEGLKKPFAASINLLAAQRAEDAVQLMGKALPCHVVAVNGQIVTVAFDVTTTQTLPHVKMPVATAMYDWLPVRVGDLGLALPSDVYLGGVSGLGGGTATFDTPGNLSALMFVPVANASWAPPGGDPNKRVVQGPDGVLVQDMAGTAKVDVTAGQISLTAGGHSVVISSAGVVIDGKVFLTHEHGNVTNGGGITNGVV